VSAGGPPVDPELELRQTAAALALALMAGFGALAPSAVPAVAAAGFGPKVVLIVGATHSVTPSYRADADAVYAEAIKYTPNVVKVYSPNATWAAVKAAVAGAQIVVYMGHGNGWPSPYTYDPLFTTKDGFGLNATAGNGDYNNKYYGEPSIATLGLAPNAIVILSHLCYASGNSEPGNAEPSVSVAKQRADNYASAFLKAGARAVLVEGHAAPESYIRALFTTHQTLDSMWRTAPSYHGHAFSFPSVRSPGYTVEMDPDYASSGFYRALTGKLDLWTDDAVGAPPTSSDPASLLVPGNASVAVDGAALFATADVAADPTTGTPAATLPLDTRLRVVAAAGTNAAGVAVVQVSGLDAAITGYVAASDLKPRDSRAPMIRTIDDGAGALSPNDDGRGDTITLKVALSEVAAWRLTFSRPGGPALAETTGSGTAVAATWNGLAAGAPVADGSYAWTLTAVDGWNNAMAPRTGSVTVDTIAPAISAVTPADGSPAVTFSPNGDGKSDAVAFGFSVNEAGAVDASVVDAAGATVRRFSAGANAGAAAISWDGRNTAGQYVADGLYKVTLAPRDRAGNVGAGVDRTVGVYGSLRNVVAAPALRYPQDRDRLSPTTTLSFVLARPATVSWKVVNAAGQEVLRPMPDGALAAGTYSFTWNGLNSAGAMVPVGRYTSVVSATDGSLGATLTAPIEFNAFSVKVSDTTPARGQTITITATSAELLNGVPSVRVMQPGIATWSVRMVRVTGVTYRVSIRLRASSRGTLTLRVAGYDTDGRFQATYLKLPLH
jgi:flagellar hook assembly protein FlgD